MKRISHHGQPINGLRPINETRDLLQQLRGAMKRVGTTRAQTKDAIALERRDPQDDGTPRTTDGVVNWIGSEYSAWHDIERLCHCIAADAKARQAECEARFERAKNGDI